MSILDKERAFAEIQKQSFIDNFVATFIATYMAANYERHAGQWCPPTEDVLLAGEHAWAKLKSIRKNNS